MDAVNTNVCGWGERPGPQGEPSGTEGITNMPHATRQPVPARSRPSPIGGRTMAIVRGRCPRSPAPAARRCSSQFFAGPLIGWCVGQSRGVVPDGGLHCRRHSPSAGKRARRPPPGWTGDKRNSPCRPRNAHGGASQALPSQCSLRYLCAGGRQLVSIWRSEAVIKKQTTSNQQGVNGRGRTQTTGPVPARRPG